LLQRDWEKSLGLGKERNSKIDRKAEKGFRMRQERIYVGASHGNGNHLMGVDHIGWRGEKRHSKKGKKIPEGNILISSFVISNARFRKLVMVIKELPARWG